MICLGLDISYTRTGVVVLQGFEIGDNTEVALVDHFTMTFPPSINRLIKAYAAITNEFVSARHKDASKCDLAIIEDSISRVQRQNRVNSARTLVKLAELGAVFKMWLEAHNRPYLTVSPTSTKKFITGRGDADKVQVASEIKRRFGIEFLRDPGNDLSDAAALALWGILTKGSK